MEVIANWFHLGRNLGLEKKELDDLKSGNDPTLALMEFIYESHKPEITVAEFEKIMEEFGRGDVLKNLEKLG